MAKDLNLGGYQYPPPPEIGKLEVIEISRVCPEDTNNIVKLTLNQQQVSLFVKSGCRKTLLPLQRCLPAMGPLMPTQTKFRPYGTKTHLPIAGQLPATLTSRNGAQHKTTIYVIDGHRTEPLLGDADAKALGILSINKGGYQVTGSTTNPADEQIAGITANFRAAGIKLHINTPNEKGITSTEQEHITQLLEDHKEVFQGIGLLKGDQVQFHIDPSIPPVRAPYRPTPLAYRAKLSEHLDNLRQHDKIEDVDPDEHSPWISNVVITEKKTNSKFE